MRPSPLDYATALVALLLALVALLLGCATCKFPAAGPSPTRCRGAVAEICDATGHWQEVVDCATAAPGRWTCTADSEVGHTCVRVDGGGP